MRVEGWEKILHDYITRHATIPFQWGVSDCLMFAADFVKEITGIDPVEIARGHYDNEITAKRLIIEHKKPPEWFFDQHFKRVHPNFAQRGDVIITEMQGMDACGIVAGRSRAVFKTDKGLLADSVKNARLAWRVE